MDGNRVLLWTMIATIVIAVATAAAAVGSLLAAWATKRATEAQLFAQLMGEYAKPEMSAALALLSHQGRAWRNDPAHRPFTQLVGIWVNNFADDAADDRLNAARRLVVSFFWKATALIRAGLLNDALKNEILALAGKDVMHGVVLPIEEALAAKLGRAAEAQRLIANFKATFPGG